MKETTFCFVHSVILGEIEHSHTQSYTHLSKRVHSVLHDLLFPNELQSYQLWKIYCFISLLVREQRLDVLV